MSRWNLYDDVELEWAREQTKETLEKQLAYDLENQRCFDEETHSVHRETSSSHPQLGTLYAERCKCGAFRWRGERNWHEEDDDDRMKRQASIFACTQVLQEMNGSFCI